MTKEDLVYDGKKREFYLDLAVYGALLVALTFSQKVDFNTFFTNLDQMWYTLAFSAFAGLSLFLLFYRNRVKNNAAIRLKERFAEMHASQMFAMNDYAEAIERKQDELIVSMIAFAENILSDDKVLNSNGNRDLVEKYVEYNFALVNSAQGRFYCKSFGTPLFKSLENACFESERLTKLQDVLRKKGFAL